MRFFEGLSDTQSPDHKVQQGAEATHAGNSGCIPGVWIRTLGQQHVAETAEKLIFVSIDVQVAEQDVMTSEEQEMQS